MSGRNFSLTERLSAFVDEQVASGRHQNHSEVVREALRRYEDEVREEAAALAVLEKVAAEGIAAFDRGDFTEIRDRQGSRELLERLNKRAAGRDRGGPARG
jgi:antitoxin ParD1/3/4